MRDTDRSVERAVRDLHSPRDHGMRDSEGNPVDNCDHCYGPDGYNATYPCATIRALDAARRDAQEPTEAEVEAADRGRVEHNIRRKLSDAEWEATRSKVEHEAMRAALIAAHEVNP